MVQIVISIESAEQGDSGLAGLQSPLSHPTRTRSCWTKCRLVMLTPEIHLTTGLMLESPRCLTKLIRALICARSRRRDCFLFCFRTEEENVKFYCIWVIFRFHDCPPRDLNVGKESSCVTGRGCSCLICSTFCP